MLRFIAGLLPAWAWFAAAALVLASAVAFGDRSGAARVKARWDAVELARQQAEADTRREDARISRAADAEFQRWRADRARRDADIARRLRDALQRPVSCPTSGLLADVPVPAAVVDRLRDAGADDGSPGAAPAVTGPGLRARPGAPGW